MSDEAKVLADTRHWVDAAVIGLNLCPFAKAVQVQGRVRYVVSQAETPEDLLYELAAELNHLHDTPPETTDTTLLVHPKVLTDFLDYNDFLEAADALVEDIGLDGVLQVASFHPQYQFDGTEADDISNYTNRAPYPTLHLLREDSIDRAVQAFPEAESIYEANMATLQKLGIGGWLALGLKK
ncbi:MAG: DUF1415 domain-containing protein [Burkholderiales bacterium]